MRSLLSRINAFHVSIGLVILTLLVFGPFMSNEFVSLDDNYLIYANPVVKTLSLGNLLSVFTHYDPQLYIPLTFLSYQINAAILGIDATAFHAVNLLLHCANVILVLIILRRLSGNLFIATVVAALFAIHPLQTEAVLWASARKDLLSGFFFLLSTLSYLRYRELPSRRSSLLWSIGFYALGLLSKVSVIMLPLWLLTIDWMQKRPVGRDALREKFPYGILAVVFGIIAVIGKSRVLQASGTALNMLLPLKSAAYYLEKIVWPSGFSVIYPYTPSGSLLTEFGLPVLGIILLLAVTILLAVRGKHRLLSFGLITYLLLLLPSFTTFWKNGFLYFASDRYVYLASIGPFVVIALLLHEARRSMPERWREWPAAALAAVIVAAVIPFTRAQSAVWANTEALYRNVLRHYPDSVMAHTNLGLELQRAKNLAEAREHYERAIALDPHSVHAYFNLSSLNTEEGRTEEAKQVTLRIVDAFGPEQILSPGDLKPFLWLTGKLERIGRPDESLRLLRKLIAIAPQYSEPHHALAERHRKNDDHRSAMKEFEAAAQQGSENPATYYYLVEYYSGGSGTTLQVIDSLEKGVALDPGNAVARQKLEELKAIAQ